MAQASGADGARVTAALVVPFTTAYFFSHYLRNVNAVLAEPIAGDMGLGASELGLLTSAYFFAAALVVLPVGILLDRFGPRRVLIAQLFATALGCAIFAISGSVAGLVLGRVIIGLGIAGCLMTGLKAVTLYFPAPRWATWNGVVMLGGGLGVIGATSPTLWLADITGWREVFLLTAVACLAICLLAVIMAPRQAAAARGAEPLGAQLKGLARVFGDAFFWRLGPVACLSLGTFLSLQGLWAAPLMRDVGGLSLAQVGDRLFVMSVTTMAGMFLNGRINDWLAPRGVTPLTFMGIGFVVLLAVEGAVAFGIGVAGYWPWAVMGFYGNISALSYPNLGRRFSGALAGRAYGALMVLHFAVAFIIQAMIGYVVELWPANAAGRYPAEAYRVAIGVFVLLQLLGLLWYVSAVRLTRGRAALVPLST